MSDDQDHIMTSSPECSSQTPSESISPPLRELSLSISPSRESSIASHISVAVLPPRDLRALLSNSPPPSPSYRKIIVEEPMEQGSTKNVRNIPVSSSHSPSRNLPPHQRTAPTLPPLNTCPPARHRSPPRTTGGTAFGLEAFKLGSPPRRHPQPHSSHQASASHSHIGRSFWVPSSTSTTTAPRTPSQHQRLASLPSIQTGHRENVYPTPVSLTSQRGFPASAATPVAHTRRQSDETREGEREHIFSRPPTHLRHPSAGHHVSLPHVYSAQPMIHRRHPSSGEIHGVRVSQQPLPCPTWAAPPPPPPAPAHPGSSAMLGRPHNLGRPRLQIHPYAPPRMDPRYYSAGGIGMHTHTHPGIPHGVPVAGLGREGVYMSSSSGMSPGGFKAPRKRADDSQLTILNDVFEKTAYPSTEERDSLAKQLGMTSRSVQIWFQNRRRAVKVDAQSAVQRAEAEADAQIMIRGPVPIIPKPYPMHARQRSESEEDGPTFRGAMNVERVVPSAPPGNVTIPGTSTAVASAIRRASLRSEDDVVMVKREVVSP
ncbi:hypothetical protein I302_108958 [Kwoniella bestiolae CBS 10118]|uniref:Homeobox domain-containing protein n=1 Tax=Kwoniella bestiolae CBS 10118 TaxID=1296100 RepID=A0A1B9FUK6_9TREE|nr:hypothetical protein I302_08100 [Kwoniella bestiolae CBS 10118]OCF22451.1 hypothetical protein I302_08100 [Kwoniella bestiolae CBS 10118]